MNRKYLFEGHANEDNSEVLFEIFMTDGNPVTDKPKGKSILIIEIRKKEGANMPHFHFTKSYGVHRDGCIRLDQALYFNHGDFYLAKITDTEAEILDYWLNQPCPLKDANGKSNWMYMKDFWNNNPFEKKIMTKHKPDYKKLNYNY